MPAAEPMLICNHYLQFVGQNYVPYYEKIAFMYEDGEVWLEYDRDNPNIDGHASMVMAREWEEDTGRYVILMDGRGVYDLELEQMWVDGKQAACDYVNMEVEEQMWLVNQLYFNRQPRSYTGERAQERSQEYLHFLNVGLQAGAHLLNELMEA